MDSLGITCTLRTDHASAVVRVIEALKREGFGVLTDIDVRQTLKEKLGVNFRPYRILGACNPPAAYKVLQAQPQVGLLLPCNVIVYELDDGSTVVSAFDPLQMVGEGSADGPLGQVAEEIRARLARVVGSLG
ncbi:MAG: DUF302 domain-containing protein [Polyangiaceae bacterium]|nr:DUF302 domain-containing protein [Polyangiaceae bacterium]